MEASETNAKHHTDYNIDSSIPASIQEAGVTVQESQDIDIHDNKNSKDLNKTTPNATFKQTLSNPNTLDLGTIRSIASFGSPNSLVSPQSSNVKSKTPNLDSRLEITSNIIKLQLENAPTNELLGLLHDNGRVDGKRSNINDKENEETGVKDDDDYDEYDDMDLANLRQNINIRDTLRLNPIMSSSGAGLARASMKNIFSSDIDVRGNSCSKHRLSRKKTSRLSILGIDANNHNIFFKVYKILSSFHRVVILFICDMTIK